MTRDDFRSLREYNDYLERVEDIGNLLTLRSARLPSFFFSVYSLVHDIDVARVMKEIEEYKRQNAVAIQANNAKLLALEQSRSRPMNVDVPAQALPAASSSAPASKV
jgi:hypothetical protein